MLKDLSKAKVIFLLNNSIFLFTYNVKTIILGQFSDSKLLYANNFQAKTSVIIEI